MSEESGVVSLLKESLAGADKDRQIFVEQLATIGTNINKLRNILTKPFSRWGTEPLPDEFGKPRKFQKAWDELLPAVGNALLMVIEHPGIPIFQSYQPPTKQSTASTPAPPIFINAQPGGPTAQANGTASRGFFSGFWDWMRARQKVKLLTKQHDKPIITSDTVTYDPKAVVHQLIPQLNATKDRYRYFLTRHQSRRTISRDLIWRAHDWLQNEIEKYFNVLIPFCRASFIYLIEKVRHDKLAQMTNMSRIAQAEAEARAMSMPWIPPEVKAIIKAAREHKEYREDGFDLSTAGVAENIHKIRKDHE